jgi:ABC-type bacteriocin/lantibiotic exporter with double-glycine peptidase domain
MRAIRTGRGAWIPSELHWLFREVRPFLHWHIASFICISVGSVLGLLAPLVLKCLIDVIVPERRLGLLIGAAGLILICYQGKAVLSSVAGYLTFGAAQGLALQLRLGLLRHLDTLSADYHESTSVGDSIYPLKEPIEEISYFGSDLLPTILRTLMATMLTLGTMLILNARMTVTILPIVPLFLLTRKYFRRHLEVYSDEVQLYQRKWSSFLEEHLSSILAVQLLRKEQRQERNAFQLLGRRYRSVERLVRAGISFNFYTSLTIAIAMSTVIAYGGWNAFSGTLTIGGLVAFYTYLTQLFEPLSAAAETYVRAKKAFASIHQVQAILALKPTITNSLRPVTFPLNRLSGIEVANQRGQMLRSWLSLLIPAPFQPPKRQRSRSYRGSHRDNHAFPPALPVYPPRSRDRVGCAIFPLKDPSACLTPRVHPLWVLQSHKGDRTGLAPKDAT